LNIIKFANDYNALITDGPLMQNPVENSDLNFSSYFIHFLTFLKHYPKIFPKYQLPMPGLQKEFRDIKRQAIPLSWED